MAARSASVGGVPSPRRGAALGASFSVTGRLPLMSSCTLIL
jgi:hypothetical protein